MVRRDGDVLLISAFDDGGREGGLFVLDDGGVDRIDSISGTGMAFDPRSGRLLRALYLPDAGNFDGALLDYSQTRKVGLRWTRGFGDLHDVRFLRHRPVAVASYQNAVVWLGRLSRRAFRLSGEPDSWHLNGVIGTENYHFATAFRRGGTFRQWSANQDASGVLFCLETGQLVRDDLSAPHDPRLLDEGWLVCNSGTGELLLLERQAPHRTVAGVELGSWPRGVAVRDNFVYVGESADRNSDDEGAASVAVVNRDSWRAVERVVLPAREIYELCFVPREIVDALRTNAPVAADLADQFCRPRRLRAPVPTPGERQDPLAPERECVAVRARMPMQLEPCQLFHVNARVVNSTSHTLVAKGANPMTVGFRWFDANGNLVPLQTCGVAMRTGLPRDLPPGHSYDIRVRVRATAEQGRLWLSLSLVHELVAWLEDIDPTTAVRSEVLVRPRPARLTSRRFGGRRLGIRYGAQQRGTGK